MKPMTKTRTKTRFRSRIRSRTRKKTTLMTLFLLVLACLWKVHTTPQLTTSHHNTIQYIIPQLTNFPIFLSPSCVVLTCLVYSSCLILSGLEYSGLDLSCLLSTCLPLSRHDCGNQRHMVASVARSSTSLASSTCTLGLTQQAWRQS